MDRYLQHYGILGMKWGVRRYENPDGTLTEAGKKRYGSRETYEKELSDPFGFSVNRKADELNRKANDRYRKEVKAANDYRKEHGLKRSDQNYRSKINAANDRLKKSKEKSNEYFFKNTTRGQNLAKVMLFSSAGIGAMAVSHLLGKHAFLDDFAKDLNLDLFLLGLETVSVAAIAGAYADKKIREHQEH